MLTPEMEETPRSKPFLECPRNSQRLARSLCDLCGQKLFLQEQRVQTTGKSGLLSL